MRPAYIILLAAVLAAGLYAFQSASSSKNEKADDTLEPLTNLSDLPMAMTLESTAFEAGGSIPEEFTCDGNRTLSPPLEWSGVPEHARSLVLIVEDPDIPEAVAASRGIAIFDHWVLFNIPPAYTGLKEGEAALGIMGSNSAGQNAYTGPCPPTEYEPKEHRYFFRLYALDAELPLLKGATKEEVLAAMQGHVLDMAELVGRYMRPEADE